MIIESNMPHQTLTYQNGRLTSTEYDYNRLGLATGKSSILGKASKSRFSAFVEPLLRDAAVFDSLSREDLRYGCWRPIDPSRAADIRDWLYRELVTFGFLLELSFCDFAIASEVTGELNGIHNAFSALLAGRARLSIVSGEPVITAMTVASHTMLISATRNLEFLGGDPVDSLHIMLNAAAFKAGRIPPSEVDALLDWADEEFVKYAIECLLGDSVSKPFTIHSNAETNANALGMVARGLCGLEWSIDGPVFIEFPKKRTKRREHTESGGQAATGLQTDSRQSC